MESPSLNEPPDQRSQTPLPSPEVVEQTAAQFSRPTPRKTDTRRSTTNVTIHRPEILDQMKGEMVICEAWEEGFFEYLPDIGASDASMDAAMESVVTDLLGQGTLCQTEGKELRFSEFQDPPSVTKDLEEAYFQPLIKICSVLAQRREFNRQASTIPIQESRRRNVAETEGANFKVDAYLKLRRSAMPTKTGLGAIGDLAVPMEYKTGNNQEAVRSNREQLLGTATFCMNDDPRRMHVYGITIEDSTMAVWYFSRSHSAKSPDLDFVEDPRMYIRVMLSLLFANEEELGYDQTVQRRLDENSKLCFVYKVGNRCFKTRRAIFEHRSLCITGRATRVWEAIEVESFENLQPLEGASPVVLKDVWLDSGSRTEGDNLREIFHELERIAIVLNEGGSDPEAFNGMDDQGKELLRQHLKDQSWKRHFLSIVCDWQGLVSKQVPAVAQPLPTLFDLSPPTTTPSSHPHHDGSRSTTSHPANLLPVAPKRLSRRYCPKRQYRVVFEEVCEVLHDVRELRDVTIALRDCVFALQLMFVAGWVHRDISSGNIYASRSKDPESQSICVRGILADLEYAKPFKPNNVQGSSDPKTGTAYFMAIEIQKQLYFCVYAEADSPSEESSEEEETPQDTSLASPFVIHNFQHDLESIFWILLWTLLARFPPTPRSPESENKFKAELSSIFQNTSMCPMEREAVFAARKKLGALLTAWLDKRLQALTKTLKVFRKFLKRRYLARGWNIDNISSYSMLHCRMRKELEKCLKTVAWTELPELRQCSSKEDLAVTTSSPVDCPTQVVIKRERSLSDTPDGNGDQISKTARVLETTDVASSRTLCRENSDWT